MKRRKQWGMTGIVCCLLLLAACGASPKEQELPQASTPEECRMQLEEKLAEYTVQWDVLNEKMEEFYTAVEQGDLQQQAAYNAFQTAMQTWCAEVSSYVLPEDWEECRLFYEPLKSLAETTEAFLKEMESVQTTEDMEAAMDAYIQNAAPVLAEMNELENEELAASDWLVGTWSVTEEGREEPWIYTYQEDGTACFPDGSQLIWRRKGSEEPEDTERWKAEFSEATGESQVYYLSKDGTDVMKQVVTKKEDGTLQVRTAVIYSTEITSVLYVPCSQS